MYGQRWSKIYFKSHDHQILSVTLSHCFWIQSSEILTSPLYSMVFWLFLEVIIKGWWEKHGLPRYAEEVLGDIGVENLRELEGYLWEEINVWWVDDNDVFVVKSSVIVGCDWHVEIEVFGGK